MTSIEHISDMLNKHPNKGELLILFENNLIEKKGVEQKLINMKNSHLFDLESERKKFDDEKFELTKQFNHHLTITNDKIKELEKTNEVLTKKLRQIHNISISSKWMFNA